MLVMLAFLLRSKHESCNVKIFRTEQQKVCASGECYMDYHIYIACHAVDSCTVISMCLTLFQAWDFICWLFADLTWVQNMADLKPKAKQILWIDSSDCASQSSASLAARSSRPWSAHQFHPSVDGRSMGMPAGSEWSIHESLELWHWL